MINSCSKAADRARRAYFGRKHSEQIPKETGGKCTCTLPKRGEGGIQPRGYIQHRPFLALVCVRFACTVSTEVLRTEWTQPTIKHLPLERPPAMVGSLKRTPVRPSVRRRPTQHDAHISEGSILSIYQRRRKSCILKVLHSTGFFANAGKATLMALFYRSATL